MITKSFHSLVLTLVDKEGYGRDDDAAIFFQSEIGVAFDKNGMDLPELENIDRFT